MRWDPKTRSISFALPSWTDLLMGKYRRHTIGVAVFLAFDILISFIDRDLANAMRQIDPEIYGFFDYITDIGDSKYTLIPIALILPFLFAIRQAVAINSIRRIVGWLSGTLLFIFCAVASSGILVNIIKVIVGRTRPILDERDGLYGFAPFTFGDSLYHSFPSGHANTAFALAIALAFLMPRLKKPLFLIAAIVAFSRVVITRHYLSDILAGGALGIYTTYWLRSYFASRGWVFIKRGEAYRIAAPGQLLATKLREAVMSRFDKPVE